MAFALTSYVGRGVEIGSVQYKKGLQQVVMTITGTAADVALDLGDASGTFWTDALADATYGSLAAKALESLQRISAQSVACVDVQSAQLLDRVQVASLTGAGQYTLATGTIAPDIAFNAADGELSYYIILTYELNNRVFPEMINLGVTGV